jgi:hypothetical protein
MFFESNLPSFFWKPLHFPSGSTMQGMPSSAPGSFLFPRETVAVFLQKGFKTTGMNPKASGGVLKPSAARDCSTYQFRCAMLPELEFHNNPRRIGNNPNSAGGEGGMRLPAMPYLPHVTLKLTAKE